MQKMRIVENPQQYLEILYNFYAYFSALEMEIGKHITGSNLTDYKQRRKTASLFNDITYFKGEIPIAAKPYELPEITNQLQAFGALYVMEGSTLGGLIISKIMQKQLNLTGPQGFSFFNCYGNRTQEMWLSFKNKLSSVADNSNEEHIIIDTANKTFSMFKHWIDSN